MRSRDKMVESEFYEWIMGMKNLDGLITFQLKEYVHLFVIYK